LELAEEYLREVEDYVEKGDAVQASEKLYKAVEECVKALAQRYTTPEHQAALKEGKWWTQMLGKAAKRPSKILREPKIEYTWAWPMTCTFGASTKQSTTSRTSRTT
jgi:plasmid stabilization system protein ParE